LCTQHTGQLCKAPNWMADNKQQPGCRGRGRIAEAVHRAFLLECFCISKGCSPYVLPRLSSRLGPTGIPTSFNPFTNYRSDFRCAVPPSPPESWLLLQLSCNDRYAAFRLSWKLQRGAPFDRVSSPVTAPQLPLHAALSQYTAPQWGRGEGWVQRTVLLCAWTQVTLVQ
jgi:hypothetical protein